MSDQTTESNTDEQEQEARRTRTRTREAQPAEREPEPGATSGSSGSAEEIDGEQRPRKRRRRGGRGRRGKGRAPSSGSETDVTAAVPRDAKEETPEVAVAADPIEEEIAKKGTRAAAKRQDRDRRNRRGRGRRRKRPTGISEEVRKAMLDAPPRTMLVTSSEQRTQIAVLEERTVVEHYVTRKEDVSYVGNIYMARVQNVLPGMEAAFLDIGKGRNGVLYAGEVAYDELDVEEGEHRIESALKPGQTVVVQVTKDPMGTKGARLTMQLSLAGRYMVLAPSDGVFGISRKLSEPERDRLRTILKSMKPEGMGVIVRTAAAEASEEALQEDLDRLLAKWRKVEERREKAKALEPIYEEPELVVRVIRDNFGPEFERLVVDDPDTHTAVKEYLGEVMPEALDHLELYQPEADEKEPPPSLFDAYHVNDQLKKALERKVWLPSGGYLIIEKTEAMTVIDVNTGRFTGKSNLEETVLKTNLEAAEAIVHQLRLRDIGGIIVIDFIDMLLEANQEQVVHRLQRELLRDRTKTRVSEVSKLGLVQMTRKNVSAGLLEVFSDKCPRCEGRGHLLTLEP